jgi:hypothetical protein
MTKTMKEWRRDARRVKVGLEPKGEVVGNIDYDSQGFEKEWNSMGKELQMKEEEKKEK